MITTQTVDFPDIEQEWRQCENNGDVPTMFQTFDWIKTWWKYFGFRGEKVLLAIYENGLLIGIAPLYATRMIKRRIPFFKMLLPMGSGESDYTGFVLKKKHERTALLALLDYLRTQRWIIFRIGDVQRESPTARFLAEAAAASRLHVAIFDHTSCPYIALPSNPDEYMVSLDNHFKKNLRSRTNRIHELGKVNFTVAPRDMNIPDAMRAFFNLHESRWALQGQQGALSGEAVKAMHAEAAERLSRYLYIGFLELNGKKIACQYGYTYNNTRYSYLRGWDPEFKKYGVANILLMHLVGEAIKSGVREYDFLRGNESYKFDFTKDKRDSVRFVISKNPLTLKLYALAEKYSRRGANDNK